MLGHLHQLALVQGVELRAALPPANHEAAEHAIARGERDRDVRAEATELHVVLAADQVRQHPTRRCHGRPVAVHRQLGQVA